MTQPPPAPSTGPSGHGIGVIALAALLLAVVATPFALHGLWIVALLPLGLALAALLRARARGLRIGAITIAALVLAPGAGLYGYLDAHTLRDLGARAGRQVLLAAGTEEARELDAWLVPTARAQEGGQRIRERFARVEAVHGPWQGRTRVTSPWLGSAALLLPPHARGEEVVDLEGRPPPEGMDALWLATRFGEEEVRVALVLADGVGLALWDLRRTLVARGRPAAVLSDVCFFRPAAAEDRAPRSTGEDVR